MTTFRTALFAAAIAAGIPALTTAQPPEDENGDRPQFNQDRGDRERRPDGGMRPDAGQRFDRGAAQQQAQPAPLPQPNFRNQEVQRQAVPQATPDRGAPDRRDFSGRGFNRPDGNPDFRNQQTRGFNGREDRQGPDNPSRRPDARGFAGNGGWDRGRPGFDRPNGNFGRPGASGWRGSDWRQDRRYDWRGFRDQHRDVFRAPRYVAPRGWGYGYRRFNVGFRLPPFLFGADYWISDPWMYRLPPVDGPYRWVRYYNDVLLIDLRSGEIVDEIPGFFW